VPQPRQRAHQAGGKEGRLFLCRSAHCSQPFSEASTVHQTLIGTQKTLTDVKTGHATPSPLTRPPTLARNLACRELEVPAASSARPRCQALR